MIYLPYRYRRSHNWIRQRLQWFECCFNKLFDIQKQSLRGVLEKLNISQNSQENTCARFSFLIKLQVLPATSLKKRLWHRCFPVNFAKFLRKPILSEHFRWLLLNVAEIWNLKNELIKTLSHKVSVTERNIGFQKKKKNC